MARRSIEELRSELEEQLSFLSDDCDRFDEGKEQYAKRMALAIRLLLHRTRNQVPLLALAGGEGAQFHDTTLFASPPGRPFASLAPISVARDNGSQRYIALLDTAPEPRLIGFAEWWAMPVIGRDSDEGLTREKLVLSVCDQDGGAHVDATLDELYAELRSERALTWNPLGLAGGVESGAVAVSVRQIAHEVLKSLRPGYAKRPRESDALLVGPPPGMRMRVQRWEPDERIEISFGPAALPRNARCWCGSGERFKSCHGSLRANP